MPVEGRDDDVVVVTVAKRFASYNEGETAAFLPEYAQELEAQGFVVMGASTGGPLNVDAPFASQQGATLHCTMGIWTGDPTAYAYQWQIDGTDVGDNSPTYDVLPAVVGHNAVCFVTATNETGSTTAPPSNEINIT